MLAYTRRRGGDFEHISRCPGPSGGLPDPSSSFVVELTPKVDWCATVGGQSSGRGAHWWGGGRVTAAYSGLQRPTAVYSGLQRSTAVYGGLQRPAGACGGPAGRPGVVQGRRGPGQAWSRAGRSAGGLPWRPDLPTLHPNFKPLYLPPRASPGAGRTTSRFVLTRRSFRAHVAKKVNIMVFHFGGVRVIFSESHT
jgi:hypothetical protein